METQSEEIHNDRKIRQIEEILYKISLQEECLNYLKLTGIYEEPVPSQISKLKKDSLDLIGEILKGDISSDTGESFEASQVYSHTELYNKGMLRKSKVLRPKRPVDSNVGGSSCMPMSAYGTQTRRAEAGYLCYYGDGTGIGRYTLRCVSDTKQICYDTTDPDYYAFDLDIYTQTNKNKAISLGNAGIPLLRNLLALVENEIEERENAIHKDW